MLAIIFKELQCYTYSKKYRRIQFLILCGFALLFFVGIVEFYANRTLNVGQQTYKFCVILLFIFQFWVPRQAVEVWHRDGNLSGNGVNGALLALSPLASWKILAGKLSAIVFWTVWSIWLTLPLFALSSYTGGLAVSQLARCGAVFLVSCIFFALVGISFALCNPPARAKGLSYGLVLLLTFGPLLPISVFEAIPALDVISPLCVVLSILNADPTSLWLWNIGLFCVLSVLIFPVLMRYKHKL